MATPVVLKPDTGTKDLHSFTGVNSPVEAVAVSFEAPAPELVERLRDMVRLAYNDGFNEGIKENTTHYGGRPWHMSKWPAALKGLTP